MLIDTHCHLTDERLADIEGVLKQAKEVGVEKVIMPSTSVEDARKALEIAEKYEQYCLVGIHPENVEDLYRFRVKPGMTGDVSGLPQGWSEIATVRGTETRNDNNGVMTEMEEIIKSSKRVVGVGEIGIDFHYDTERKTEQKQRELFRAQMEMAQRNNLPVAIHMRDAEVEMTEELEMIMKKYQSGDGFTPSGTNGPLRSGMTGDDSGLPRFGVPKLAMTEELKKIRVQPKGQFHCFAGSEEFLKVILEMGFYVSFGGNITYKSAGGLRDLLKLVPRNRLLLETDSPYLPPEPRRGTVNTPANVKITAEFVARELGISFEEIAKTTSQNAICLYSLDI